MRYSRVLLLMLLAAVLPVGGCGGPTNAPSSPDDIATRPPGSVQIGEVKEDTSDASRGEPFLVFMRDGSLWTAEMDGSSASLMSLGAGPHVQGSISPIGNQIAYSVGEGTGHQYTQHVAVLDVVTGKRRVFRDLSCRRAHSPAWSPDGELIAFSTQHRDRWIIATVSAEGTDLRLLDKQYTCMSPVWTRRGIFCSNLRNLLLIRDDLVVESWSWEQLLGDLSYRVSVPMRLYPSDDGTKIMLVLSTEDDDVRGTTGAVFVSDLETNKLEQWTPNELTVRDASWLPGSEGIIFSATENNERNRKRLFNREQVRFDLYRLHDALGTFELFLKNAESPSVSRGEPDER